MRAGRLRHRITLYDFVTQRDALGGVTEAWSNARSCYAAVDMISAREVLARPGVAEEAVFKFEMRYDSTFAATGKITLDGADYYPSQVRNVDGRNRMLEVLATKRRPT